MYDKKTGRNGGVRATQNSKKHLKYSPPTPSKKGHPPGFAKPRHRSETNIQDRIRDALVYIDPSPRDLWLRIGMAVKSELGDDGFETWIEWSRQDQSYNARDARDVWKSIRPDGGISVGTLFFSARQNGWRDKALTGNPRHQETAHQNRQALHRQTEIAVRHQRQENGAKQLAVKRRARAVWDSSKRARADHPYLVKKRIRPHVARERHDELVIPVRNADGVLQTLQFINPNGSKRFLIGGRVRGNYCPIGYLNSPVCLVEGFATGATIHEATGYAVAVAFNAGNLLPVGQALRAKFPDIELRFCGDDDWHNPKNIGRQAAIEAAMAVGGTVVFPSFGGDR